MSSNPKLYRIMQWVLFAPLLLPIGLVVGAVEGIQKMAGTVIQQIRAESSSVS